MSQKIKWLGLLIVGCALIMGPWAVRNTILQNDLVIVDTMGGLNLYHGNYEHTPLNRAWAAIGLSGEKAWYFGHEQTLSQMNEAQKQKWAIQKAKEFIRNNKILSIKRFLIKAANFWGLERTVVGGIIDGYYPELNKKVYLVSISSMIFSLYILVTIGAVFGFVYNFKLIRHDIFFILLLIAYFTGMHAMTFGHTRYHLPLIPLMAIFASWGLIKIKSIWEKRNKRSFTLAIILSLIFVFIWVREVFFLEGERYLRNINF